MSPRSWRAAAAHPSHPATAVLALTALGEATGRAAITDVRVHVGLAFVVLALLTTVPAAFLRPLAAAVTLVAAAVLSVALFDALTVAGAVATIAALYRCGRRTAVMWPALLGLPFVGLALARGQPSEAAVLSVVLAAAAPAAVLGGVATVARQTAIQYAAAGQEMAGTLMEHTARGERARIARELHDVVAHHISMIAVQAETARLTTPDLPARGARQLRAIGDTARAALTEMRRLLGVLREDADTGPAELAPQPGLRQLNELVDAARSASGSATRLILCGAPLALDPGVELTAYRIVQEALTNARRHAPGAAVDVELHYADDALLLHIRDNGPGPPGPVPIGGHGLLGMRERAAAAGGELHTGAAAGGGFLVTARLPGKGER